MARSGLQLRKICRKDSDDDDDDDDDGDDDGDGDGDGDDDGDDDDEDGSKMILNMSFLPIHHNDWFLGQDSFPSKNPPKIPPKR